MKKQLPFIAFLAVSILAPSFVFAHSTVTPSETFTAKNETYSLSVPTEKDVPTVGVRLLVPDVLDRVTPLVKAGWKIKVTKNSEAKVTEIEWTGGSIPPGQKDVFLFSARAPQQPTTLMWKAYQTYRSGEIVAWDKDPHSSDAHKTGEENVANPYSTTAVKATTTAVQIPSEQKTLIKILTAISLTSLALSIIAIASAFRRRNV